MSIQIGKFEVHVVSGGKFLLDGGTMFGVVPKTLWGKNMKTDEDNRVEWETNCLLVKGDSGTILIESGIGYDFSEKEREIYGMKEEDHILSSLKMMGVEANEVGTVLLSHLHFDHAGGVVRQEEGNAWEPVFPNAVHMAQKKEWEDAMKNYGVMKSSYQPERLRVLEQRGLLRLMDGDSEPEPGIRCFMTPGHCRGHQVIVVESEGQTLLFCGDLIPSSLHVKASWLAAYDLFPHDTMIEKNKILEWAEKKNAILSFYHDPEIKTARVKKNDKGEFELVAMGA